MRRFWRWRSGKVLSVGLAIALLWLSSIPIKIAIALHQAPVPQAIFVLGSDLKRMEFAAQFWQSHSNLKIWVSDFKSNEQVDRQIFGRWGVPQQQIRFDGRATDTVTNFTTLVDEFENQKLQHLYLITSNYHMRRARAIAAIVLGSQGIVVKPVEVPSPGDKPETILRVLRDCGRSLLWIVTGRTGASLNSRIQS